MPFETDIFIIGICMQKDKEKQNPLGILQGKFKCSLDGLMLICPLSIRTPFFRETFTAVLRKLIQRLINLEDPETFSKAVTIAKGIEYNDEFINGKHSG